MFTVVDPDSCFVLCELLSCIVVETLYWWMYWTNFHVGSPKLSSVFSMVNNMTMYGIQSILEIANFCDNRIFCCNISLIHFSFTHLLCIVWKIYLFVVIAVACTAVTDNQVVDYSLVKTLESCTSSKEVCLLTEY